MKRCELNILGKKIFLDCQNDFLYEIVLKNYSRFHVITNATDSNDPADLHYELKQAEKGIRYLIIRNKKKFIPCQDPGLFVYFLEKDLTIELEKLCSTLFFIHGAALEIKGKVLLLTGRSGAGKSTTTWGLLNNGFNYLSDELAPVQLDTLHVSPYPHALCLKSHPPLYPLPEDILKTNRTMHVPTELLPAEVHLESFPLSKIVIIEYSATHHAPELTRLGRAQACMNIYTNGLNQLAHANDGLAAASRIATEVDCYSLAAAGLKETCESIHSLFE